MEIAVGDIVISKAGRDKGQYFVVMELLGEYAFVSNGKLRKADSPKKKKLKHLSERVSSSEYIGAKLRAGEKVTNTELRRELSEYQDD